MRRIVTYALINVINGLFHLTRYTHLYTCLWSPDESPTFSGLLALVWPPLTHVKMIWVGAGQVVYSRFIRAAELDVSL